MVASDDAELRRLSCWRLRRDGCEDTFWNHYPGMAETCDSMEVTAISWYGGSRVCRETPECEKCGDQFTVPHWNKFSDWDLGVCRECWLEVLEHEDRKQYAEDAKQEEGKPFSDLDTIAIEISIDDEIVTAEKYHHRSLLTKEEIESSQEDLVEVQARLALADIINAYQALREDDASDR